MLRILTAMSLIAVAFSCAHKDASKGFVKLSGRNHHADLDALPGASEPSRFDSTGYIGYVDYFPETREFYTVLFFQEGKEYPDEDLLQSKLDSVISFDDDWGRERLPMQEARKFLVLDGLDTLSIYNRNQQLICECPLTRVEYLWNGLDSYFIAVFGSDKKFFEQTEELYGVGSGFSAYLASEFAAQEYTDNRFDNYLRERLNMTRALDWDMRHYRIVPPGATYSIVSAYSMASNEALSYLTLTDNNEVLILNEEVNNFHYLNILPVPIHVNGQPLLLISAGYPSSDVLWDYLAGFDGSTYQAIDYNRIHRKNIGHPRERIPSVPHGNKLSFANMADTSE